MEATVKVIKNFGKCEDANIFALYIRTPELEANINQLKGQTVQILKGDEVIMGSKATNDQIIKAKQMLAQGIKPEIVADEVGCGLSTAYKIKKSLTDVDIQAAIQSGPVTTRMMNKEEIERYGPPCNPSPEFKYPKECRIALGPIHIDHLEAEIKAATAIFKTIGIQKVRVSIETV